MFYHITSGLKPTIVQALKQQECSVRLTDSLHLSLDPDSDPSLSAVEQRRDCSPTQLTRWPRVAELQQQLAGCVSGNAARTSLFIRG